MMLAKIGVTLALFFGTSTTFAAGKIQLPFELPWLNNDQAGATYKSADHPTSVFVLEFFQNFCGGCNENAENVDALATEYAGQNVQVLDVSLDRNDGEIRRWIANHNPNHPVLKDVGTALWRQVGAGAIPTMVILDCRGTITFQHTDVWSTEVKNQIRTKINSLLADTCTP